MRIDFHSSERGIVESLQLPLGTTLLELTDPDENKGLEESLAWYEIDEAGEMVMITDIVERDRNATDEDRKQFENFTKEQTLEWWALTYIADVTPYWQHQCANDLWWKYFKYLKLGGGYCPETNQTAFEVSLYRDESFKKQFEEAQMVVPLIKEVTLIKYSKDNKGSQGKNLEIFESTLSENGIYSLQIFEDVIELIKTTYGRTELLRTFSTLKDAMKYIARHHYYKEAE